LSGTDETRARHPSVSSLRIGTMETLPWEDGILAVAALFRRRDGSYRFENVFRYVLSSPSRNPTPART
jgi:hypothetical protein